MFRDFPSTPSSFDRRCQRNIVIGATLKGSNNMEIIRADKPHLIEKFKQLVAEDAQGKNIIKFQSSSREL